jgi:phosphoserine aminotransferase
MTYLPPMAYPLLVCNQTLNLQWFHSACSVNKRRLHQYANAQNQQYWYIYYPSYLCKYSDLMGNVVKNQPILFDYATQANNDSMYNTPSTYPWYVASRVFEWLKEQGGLSAIAKINECKAKTLYEAIDGSDFYSNPVAKKYRSWMNVPFLLANEDLNSLFLEKAANNGLITLKGHRSVGGMRASIYNAMPQEGVDQLVAFMQDFERENG